jgi:hypothetical protein
MFYFVKMWITSIKIFYINCCRYSFLYYVCIMKQQQKLNLEVGSKLYWTDAPEILAGIVVRFTPKRDVVINFVSGNALGERNYSISMAKKFIIK